MLEPRRRLEWVFERLADDPNNEYAMIDFTIVRAHYLFSLTMCWNGLTVNRSGSFAHIVPMYSYGVRSLQGLEPSGEVGGHQKAVQVRVELIMRSGVIPFHCSFRNRPVHAFDRSIRPRRLWFREPVFDPMRVAAPIKHRCTPLRRWPGAITQRRAELAAVLGQERMDRGRNDSDEAAQERR